MHTMIPIGAVWFMTSSFFYTKGEKWIWNPEEEYQPLPESTVRNWYSNEEVTDKNIVNRLGIPIPKGTVRYFNKADITGAGTNPNDKPFKGIMPPQDATGLTH